MMSEPTIKHSSSLLEAKSPVVIWNYGGIGDHLLGLPAIRALANLFGERLRVICYPGTRSLFLSELPPGSVLETATYDRYGRSISLDGDGRGAATIAAGGSMWMFDYADVARQIGGDCDLLVSLNPTHSLGAHRLMELLLPRHSVGFAPSFEVPVPAIESKHRADVIFETVRCLDPTAVIEDYAGPSVAARSYIELAHRRRSLASSTRVLVVHADTSPEKMWPPNRFRKLLDCFLDSHPEFGVFLVGARDIGLGLSHHNRMQRFIAQELPLSLALVGQADLFLGVDSGLLHCADLHRVPGVGLFGPTDEEIW